MTLRDILLICVLTPSLSGCSALPSVTEPAPLPGKDQAQESVAPAAPLPAAELRARSPAVNALLAKARSDRAEGNPEKAMVSLERALRIEPQDPELWLELAAAAFDKEDFQVSAEFADRAGRMAGNNEELRREALKLGQAARLQMK